MSIVDPDEGMPSNPYSRPLLVCTLSRLNYERIANFCGPYVTKLEAVGGNKVRIALQTETVLDMSCLLDKIVGPIQE